MFRKSRFGLVQTRMSFLDSGPDLFHRTHEESLLISWLSDFRYLESYRQSLKQKYPQILNVLAPKFCRGGPRSFWTCFIKSARVLITRQSFTAIGRSSEIPWRNKTRSQAVARIADRTAKNCRGHRSCDHSIAHMPFPIGSPLEPNLYL